MPNPLDLDGYLARIRWTAPLEPTLETLAGLLDAHTARIPFENLDVLLGRPIRLDLESLQEKLVARRRGGYCFEHATLFAAVLERVGFQCARQAARVLLMSPASAAARTHMFLTVVLDGGTFIVDPGFGGHSPRVPVPVVDQAEIRVGHEVFRLARADRVWFLEEKAGESFRRVWSSTLEPELAVDFEMANHYTSSHPRSAFVNRLLMRAVTDEGYLTVVNRRWSVLRGSERASREIRDRAELRSLLVSHFGFDLPEVEQLAVPTLPEWA